MFSARTGPASCHWARREISDELGFASHGRIADDTLMIGIDLIGKIGDGLFDDFLFRRKIFV